MFHIFNHEGIALTAFFYNVDSVKKAHRCLPFVDLKEDSILW